MICRRCGRPAHEGSYSIAGAAVAIGVTPRTIGRMLADGRLATTEDVGVRVGICPESVERQIAARSAGSES